MAMIDHHSAALINELRRHGITVSADDVPGIIQTGIDNLLEGHGKELKLEDITTLHLMLHELRHENVKR